MVSAPRLINQRARLSHCANISPQSVCRPSTAWRFSICVLAGSRTSWSCRSRDHFESLLNFHNTFVPAADDPTFFTLQWYRCLLESEQRVKEVSLRGRIL